MRLGAKPAHELLDDLALPREWQPILAAHSRDAGIEFLSSPFDRAAVDELDALDVAAFKIASFELVDIPLIEYAASKGRPLILSTGMASLGEIEDAVAAANRAGAAGVCLLQCASLYPSPPHIMNLRAIPTMAATFGVPVGLSDHTLGIHVAAGRDRVGRAPAREALHPRPHALRPRSPVRDRTRRAQGARRARARRRGGAR